MVWTMAGSIATESMFEPILSGSIFSGPGFDPPPQQVVHRRPVYRFA